ncbi:MAG: CPBP family intramembrane glutamic endopeptidase [Candidatus Dormibacteria bacterium]
MLVIVVLALVVEETTFRGFIMGGLRSRTGVGWAAVLSSTVFALAHTVSVGGSTLLLGRSFFVAGVALAMVYQWTRSLYRGWSSSLVRHDRGHPDLPDQHGEQLPLKGM